MNKRRSGLLIALVTSLLALGLAAPASAHVFVRDASGKTGAVLHINPADDPIAGQPASFVYDVQGQQFNAESTARLVITDAAGETVDVPVRLSGSFASASYTFPSQGLYTMSLTTKVDKRAVGFTYELRVDRGVVNEAPKRKVYAWADVGQTVAGASLLVIAVIAYNKRKDIARYSQS